MTSAIPSPLRSPAHATDAPKCALGCVPDKRTLVPLTRFRLAPGIQYTSPSPVVAYGAPITTSAYPSPLKSPNIATLEPNPSEGVGEVTKPSTGSKDIPDGVPLNRNTDPKLAPPPPGAPTTTSSWPSPFTSQPPLTEVPKAPKSAPPVSTWDVTKIPPPFPR